MLTQPESVNNWGVKLYSPQDIKTGGPTWKLSTRHSLIQWHKIGDFWKHQLTSRLEYDNSLEWWLHTLTFRHLYFKSSNIVVVFSAWHTVATYGLRILLGSLCFWADKLELSGLNSVILIFCPLFVCSTFPTAFPQKVHLYSQDH